ncbi:hypothetical protein GCM10028807_14950 [Spirosoma daeguense]
MKPKSHSFLSRPLSALGVLLSGSSLLLSLTGCNKADYLDINAADRPPLNAQVRFVNARPVNTPLQFWTFTTQVTTSPVAVNQASPYLATVFGSVQINFTEGSSTSYKASQQFGNSATFTATGRPNGPIATFYHTVFAARTANAASDSLILFYDDLKAPAARKAKVRFVNLSPGVGALDVRTSSGTALFTSVSYGRAANSALSGETLNAFSLGPFVSVDAGTLTLNASRVGGQAVGEAKSLTFESGKIYTVFTNGVPGSAASVAIQRIEHPVQP